MAGLQNGTVLSDTYRIVRLVGRGGMGEVYEASHLRLSGRYAIKVLLGDTAARPEVFARFQREAEVTSGIKHPNIVNVVDFNHTPDGYPYIAMEFLEGRELGEEIAACGPMSLGRVVDIVSQVAGALSAAHTRGIIHRDLKPQNLFVQRFEGDDREIVKLVDFGISKVREATTQLTQQAVIMGTPHYMSPEQALGRIDLIDHRTDQFALGALTYELLAGVPAFFADSATAVLFQVVHEPPPPLRELNPAVPADVARVVERALAKSREDRYASVLEFQRALRTAARMNVPSSAPSAEALAKTLARVPNAELPLPAARTTLSGGTGERIGGPPVARHGGVGARLLFGAVALGAAAGGVWGVLRLPKPSGPSAADPPAVTTPAAAVAPTPTQPAAAMVPPPVIDVARPDPTPPPTPAAALKRTRSPSTTNHKRKAEAPPPITGPSKPAQAEVQGGWPAPRADKPDPIVEPPPNAAPVGPAPRTLEELFDHHKKRPQGGAP